jgi:hypothetical protein
MANFWRRLFALDVDPQGVPTQVSNPPTTEPTSPLTRPISVTSAADFYRYGYTQRRALMSIPAFRRAAMLIAGVAGALPYHSYDKNDERVDSPFLVQPERNLGITRNVTFTKIAMDLLFDGSSLLLITERYADGYPKSAEYVPFLEWSQDERTGDVIYEGEKQDPANVCKFDSPFSGLSHDAAPTVALFGKLRESSFKYFDSPQAREYFKPTEGQDPSPEEVASFLSDWDKARQSGVSAFVPSGVDLAQMTQMSPEELTLNSANEYAISEVARLTGIDATWLSINVTTRTYSNIIQERRNFLDFVAFAFIQSIEQRLSLGDILPTGTYCRANVDAFLRTDTLERYQAHAIGLDKQFLTIDEVRAMESRPSLPSTPSPEEPT